MAVPAVVVGLFAIMTAARRGAVLGRRELLKPWECSVVKCSVVKSSVVYCIGVYRATMQC